MAGLRVLDVASGSGLVAIAAAVAGAAAVTANDIDPHALAAIALNAHANDVAVDVSGGDLLDGDGDDAEVVLAGDVFYSQSMAERMLRSCTALPRAEPGPRWAIPDVPIYHTTAWRSWRLTRCPCWEPPRTRRSARSTYMSCAADRTAQQWRGRVPH